MAKPNSAIQLFWFSLNHPDMHVQIVAFIVFDTGALYSRQTSKESVQGEMHPCRTLVGYSRSPLTEHSTQEYAWFAKKLR